MNRFEIIKTENNEILIVDNEESQYLLLSMGRVKVLHHILGELLNDDSDLNKKLKAWKQ